MRGFFAWQAVDHGHRFDGGIVVQAQHHQIGRGHQFALGLGVFAAGRVDAQNLDLGHQGQTFADLQTCGAGFAVDENVGHVGDFLADLGPVRQLNVRRKAEDWCVAA